MRSGIAFSALIVAPILGAVPSAWADSTQGGHGIDKGTIGIGAMLGEPTGICGKLYVRDDQAIQVAAGGAFIGGGIQAHVDYVFHPYILQTRPSFVLATYVGPGVRLIQYSEHDENYVALGVRGVGGLLFDFNHPLDAFVEIAGILEYAFGAGPGGQLSLNASAGVRYYF